jgi:hypothetical protein
MKEKLVELLTSKVGLDQEKAEKSVDTVLEYLKNNPGEITSYLQKFNVGGVADKIGGMFS